MAQAVVTMSGDDVAEACREYLDRRGWARGGNGQLRVAGQTSGVGAVDFVCRVMSKEEQERLAKPAAARAEGVAPCGSG